MADKIFPPLPPSDDESVAKNVYDPQFRVGARDFWGDNKRERINLDDPKKCDHYFSPTTDGVTCKKCHLGWIGKELEIKDGKLHIHNQLVKF